MYSSLAEYRQAYKKVELRYVLMAKQREDAAYLKNNLSVERGYAVYQNALNNLLGFLVIGRTNVDKAVHKRVVGSAIENDMLGNFGGSGDGGSIDHRIVPNASPLFPGANALQTQGSILHYPRMNPAQGFHAHAPWHFLINDSFILAGVHKQQEFQIASPRTPANIKNHDGPTVTFREFIGLRAFGYKIKKTALNEIAYCVDSRSAQQASFAGYWDAIDKYIDKPEEFYGPACNW